MPVTSSSQEIRKYFMFTPIFCWDYPPLHHSSAELVLCGLNSRKSYNHIRVSRRSCIILMFFVRSKETMKMNAPWVYLRELFTTIFASTYLIYVLNPSLHKGGTMLPNIWFFGSRVLRPQYFRLIIFVIAEIVFALLLAKKKKKKKNEIGLVVLR